MISLRKLLNQDGRPISPDADEVPITISSGDRATDLAGYVDAYQAALSSMATNGQKAIPSLGASLSSSLSAISTALGESSSPESIRSARQDLDTQLGVWSAKAEQQHKDSERAIRELLAVISRAAEATGMRDEKFGRELGEMSSKLRGLAGIDNIAHLRRSVLDQATALTACIARMADESRASTRRLTAEIADYRNRLQVSERRALIDALTGLCNRRGFEQELDLRVITRQQFSLLVADLNGFKAANDRYGHMAGDQILRQFAAELKAQFTPEDTVARWGGDEFVAIIAGPAKEGIARADRVRKWVFGEYQITVDNQTKTISVDAALGTAAWNGVETGQELFIRADREMYKAKDQALLTAAAPRT